MRSLSRRPRTARLAALLTLFPIAVSGQSTDRTWTPEQREVIEAASTGPVGIETDFERWESGYHSDWTYWRMGTDQVRPKDVHMDLVRGVIGDGNRVTGFELTPVDVIVRGETALLRYNAVETLVNAAGEEQIIHYSAASVFAMEDGRWLQIASNLFYPEG